MDELHPDQVPGKRDDPFTLTNQVSGKRDDIFILTNQVPVKRDDIFSLPTRCLSSGLTSYLFPLSLSCALLLSGLS